MPCLQQRLRLPHGEVWIQRDDLLHPLISGNKWRKLAGWIERAKCEGKKVLVTFGGAYSNHLVATAAAAHEQGWQSLGLLRGHEPMENEHLRVAREQGMRLVQLTRGLYRDKPAAWSFAQTQLAGMDLDIRDCLLIPEGGCGPEGLVGFGDLLADWRQSTFSPKHIFHASATGTTAAGLAAAMTADVAMTVEAVLVLKNLAEQEATAAAYCGASERITWHVGYEHGGYAKCPPILLDFTKAVAETNNIPLEPIYTGKALWALNEMLQVGRFAAADCCFLHTGGVLHSLGEHVY